MGWGDGLDMFSQFEGCLGPWSKKWIKKPKLNGKRYTIRFVSTSWSFGGVNPQTSKSDENDRAMAIQSWGKSDVIAYFRPKIAHFGHIFWDNDFRFVLSNINIDGQTYLEVNWSQIGYLILTHEDLQKATKMAIH